MKTFDRTYRRAALLWGAALLIGSLQPIRPAHIHFGFAHHLLHFIGFGILAFLAAAGFGNPVRFSWRPAAASFLFGLAIELLQHWQYSIPMEWRDVRDNAIGILTFVAIYQRLGQARHPAIDRTS
jgi:hypothetical protein